MDRYYYKLAKISVFIGVLFFASHLLFPQYVYAAATSEDQMRVDLSEMNIANSPEPIIYDGSNSSTTIDTVSTTSVETATSTNASIPIAQTVAVKEPAAAKDTPPSKEEIKEFVRLEAIRAGLNPDEAEEIVSCESHFNPQAVNTRNKNGTKDMGLWQINSIHKTISNADKFDYKAATRWALNKRLNEGNWSAWNCARQLAIR